MAQALQIDTLAFSKKLREAGADEGLAEAIVEGISAADTSELVTKGDLDQAVTKLATKGDLTQAIATLKSEMASKADLEKLNDKIDTSVTALQKDMTVLNDKIDTSVSALQKDVTALDAKIDTSVKALEEKMATKAELAEVKVEIATSKAELLKWMFGALFAQTGIILAVVKLL